MKAEINSENKAKFFAQYWGQVVLILEEGEDYPYECEAGLIEMSSINTRAHIKLRPISSITDEGAIEVAKIMDWETPTSREDMREIRDQLAVKIKHKWVTWVCVDYLRSKGYALPWMCLSVDEMVQAGWIKLEAKS